MTIAQKVIYICEEVAPSGNVIPLKGKSCPEGYEQREDSPGKCFKKTSGKSAKGVVVGGVKTAAGSALALSGAGGAVGSILRGDPIGAAANAAIGIGGAYLARSGVRQLKANVD